MQMHYLNDPFQSYVTSTELVLNFIVHVYLLTSHKAWKYVLRCKLYKHNIILYFSTIQREKLLTWYIEIMIGMHASIYVIIRSSTQHDTPTQTSE